MQLRAMSGEPSFRPINFGAQSARDRPESWRMIKMDKMRHFMRGEIIENEWRRHDQAP
jgi:hypothetical protein